MASAITAAAAAAQGSASSATTGRDIAPHLGVPAGWVARYPCRPRLRPVIDAPRGAFTATEACAAAVGAFEAWVAAARAGAKPFTPATLADTGRVDAVVLLYGPGTLVVRPDGSTAAAPATTFSVELHFAPGEPPVTVVVDPHRGVRRLYRGEPFLSRAAYDRALHGRSR